MSQSSTDMSARQPRPKRPLSIGAGAVVVHEQRVLLVRNTYGVTKGRYPVPARARERARIADQAAVRETFRDQPAGCH